MPARHAPAHILAQALAGNHKPETVVSAYYKCSACAALVHRAHLQDGDGLCPHCKMDAPKPPPSIRQILFTPLMQRVARTAQIKPYIWPSPISPGCFVCCARENVWRVQQYLYDSKWPQGWAVLFGVGDSQADAYAHYANKLEMLIADRALCLRA